MTLSLSALNIRGILLDIEGTTTPIAFVHDVLFPFARAGVRDYLSIHLASAEVLHDLARLREEHARDVAQQLDPPALANSDACNPPASGVLHADYAELDAIVAYIHWLMDRDRKSTGLKSLQGKIWEEGYRSGALKSQLFPDVPGALERWHEAGLRIAIFSSGSVLAQKLLFAHTIRGNLTQFIDGYFDTTTGPKTEADSYRRVSAGLGVNPKQTLFISDVTAEITAATNADLQTALCIRPGNPPQPGVKNQITIRSFDELTD